MFCYFLSAAERPNILWIVIDDQGPDWGCYGNDLVHTPNLDSLAADGVLYENAFAVSPVCSPSHTSIFTGNYPTIIGCPHHRSHYSESLPEGFSNVEDVLSSNGYFTVNFISEGNSRERILFGASGKTDLNYNRDRSKAIAGQSGAQIFDHIHKFDNAKPESYFTGGVWDKRKAGQPFFAYLNIETGKAHGFGYGNTWAKQEGISANGKVQKVPDYLIDNTSMKRKFASIYDSVSHTDFVIGRFLKELKKCGLYDNTMIAIAGDHGYAILRHKQTLYDSGLKVPMLIKFPKNKIKGREGRLVSLIDLAPTSLAVTGIKHVSKFCGSNLMSNFKRGAIFGARDGVDNFFDRSRTIRTDRYRLIVHDYPEIPYLNGNYAKSRLLIKEMKEAHEKGLLNKTQLHFLAAAKPKVELYDLQEDPFEIHNLANVDKYKPLINELKEQLTKWQEKNNDRFRDYRKNGKPLKPGTKVSHLIPWDKKK